MKALVTTIGILLIVFGIVTLGYHGFTYTKQEKVAQFGTIQLTTNTKKQVYFPPILGGLSFIAGIALVFAGRKK